MKFVLILLLHTCYVSSEFLKTTNNTLSIKKDTNNSPNEYIINNNFDVVNHLKVPVNISGDHQNNVELISVNSNTNSKNDYEEFPEPSPARSYLENYVVENKRCCVVVYPPKCDIYNCTVSRRRECGDICTQDVVVLDSPFFSGINYTEFLPSTNLTNEMIEETFTLPKLAEMNSTSFTGISPNYPPNPPMVFPWRNNGNYMGGKLNKTVFPANTFPRNFQPFPFPQQNLPLPPPPNTMQNTTYFLPPQQFPINWYPFKPLGGQNGSFPTRSDPLGRTNGIFWPQKSTSTGNNEVRALNYPGTAQNKPIPVPLLSPSYQYQQQPVYGFPYQPFPLQQRYK